jgi:hypothetical protein
MSEIEQLINNEQPSSTPQLCIGIMQDYTNGHSLKVAAVKSILAVFNESSAYEDFQPDEIDTAVGTYYSHVQEALFCVSRGLNLI